MEIFAVLRKTNRLVIRPVPIAGTPRGYVNLAYLTGRDDLRVVGIVCLQSPNAIRGSHLTRTRRSWSLPLFFHRGYVN